MVKNMINEQPYKMKIFHLEVLVMPQGEIICNGKTIGWFKDLSEFLFEPEPHPAGK